MGTAVGIENLCGGMGTAAFVALLMSLCNQQFSATQFALLSSLSAVGRTYLAGPLTPLLVQFWLAYVLYIDGCYFAAKLDIAEVKTFDN